MRYRYGAITIRPIPSFADEVTDRLSKAIAEGKTSFIAYSTSINTLQVLMALIAMKNI